MIAFRYSVVCTAALAIRERLVRRVRPSSYVSTLLTPFGFEVRVHARERPLDDAHVLHGFEAARSLAMITEGTLIDSITHRLFPFEELDAIDATSLDAHVSCVVEPVPRPMRCVASHGMVKYGLAELRMVVGNVDLAVAREAAHMLELACSGIVGGVFPEEGDFDMLGEPWQVIEGSGVALLERCA